MDVDEEESKELKKLKKECQAMIKMLKHLQEQEISLKSQNLILAREALNLGYRDSLLTTITSTSASCATRRRSAGTDADGAAAATATGVVASVVSTPSSAAFADDNSTSKK